MKKLILLIFILYFFGSPKINFASQEIVFDDIYIVTQNLQQCSILNSSILEYENFITILNNNWNKSEEIAKNLKEQLLVCENKTSITKNFCSIEKEALESQKKIHSDEVNLLNTQLEQCKPTFLEKMKNALGWFASGAGTTLVLVLLSVI